MKKTIGVLIFAIIFAFLGFNSTATASNTYSTQTVTDSNASRDSNLDVKLNNVQNAVSAQTDKVTIQEAEKWAERKGFEVVHLLQKIVQPFAIIIFIVSAFLAMAGGFGNSQLVGRGLWGMAIAVIMYAVVLYAPEILDSVLGWLST